MMMMMMMVVVVVVMMIKKLHVAVASIELYIDWTTNLFHFVSTFLTKDNLAKQLVLFAMCSAADTPFNQTFTYGHIKIDVIRLDH